MCQWYLIRPFNSPQEIIHLMLLPIDGFRSFRIQSPSPMDGWANARVAVACFVAIVWLYWPLVWDWDFCVTVFFFLSFCFFFCFVVLLFCSIGHVPYVPLAVLRETHIPHFYTFHLHSARPPAPPNTMDFCHLWSFVWQVCPAGLDMIGEMDPVITYIFLSECFIIFFSVQLTLSLWYLICSLIHCGANGHMNEYMP